MLTLPLDWSIKTWTFFIASHRIAFHSIIFGAGGGTVQSPASGARRRGVLREAEASHPCGGPTTRWFPQEVALQVKICVHIFPYILYMRRERKPGSAAKCRTVLPSMAAVTNLVQFQVAEKIMRFSSGGRVFGKGDSGHVIQ